jgi:hypothetical protein
MTVEEALVALLAAVASIFLFLGLAQALGTLSSRSRRPENRPELSRRTRVVERRPSIRTAAPVRQVETEPRDPR